MRISPSTPAPRHPIARPLARSLEATCGHPRYPIHSHAPGATPRRRPANPAHIERCSIAQTAPSSVGACGCMPWCAHRLSRPRYNVSPTTSPLPRTAKGPGDEDLPSPAHSGTPILVTTSKCGTRWHPFACCHRIRNAKLGIIWRRGQLANLRTWHNLAHVRLLPARTGGKWGVPVSLLPPLKLHFWYILASPCLLTAARVHSPLMTAPVRRVVGAP
jgi:hypothetical protein